MSDEDNIVPLHERKKSFGAAIITAPGIEGSTFEGPFTVTIADKNGKMFEVTFPDQSGIAQPETAILMTSGHDVPGLTVNLLSGALRCFAGLP